MLRPMCVHAWCVSAPKPPLARRAAEPTPTTSPPSTHHAQTPKMCDHFGAKNVDPSGAEKCDPSSAAKMLIHRAPNKFGSIRRHTFLIYQAPWFDPSSATNC